jgi:hypothetical protein
LLNCFDIISWKWRVGCFFHSGLLLSFKNPGARLLGKFLNSVGTIKTK